MVTRLVRVVGTVKEHTKMGKWEHPVRLVQVSRLVIYMATSKTPMGVGAPWSTNENAIMWQFASSANEMMRRQQATVTNLNAYLFPCQVLMPSAHL